MFHPQLIDISLGSHGSPFSGVTHRQAHDSGWQLAPIDVTLPNGVVARKRPFLDKESLPDINGALPLSIRHSGKTLWVSLLPRGLDPVNVQWVAFPPEVMSNPGLAAQSPPPGVQVQMLAPKQVHLVLGQVRLKSDSSSELLIGQALASGRSRAKLEDGRTVILTTADNPQILRMEIWPARGAVAVERPKLTKVMQAEWRGNTGIAFPDETLNRYGLCDFTMSHSIHGMFSGVRKREAVAFHEVTFTDPPTRFMERAIETWEARNRVPGGPWGLMSRAEMTDEERDFAQNAGRDLIFKALTGPDHVSHQIRSAATGDIRRRLEDGKWCEVSGTPQMGAFCALARKDPELEQDCITFLELPRRVAHDCFHLALEAIADAAHWPEQGQRVTLAGLYGGICKARGERRIDDLYKIPSRLRPDIEAGFVLGLDGISLTDSTEPHPSPY